MIFELGCGHVFAYPRSPDNPLGWPEPRLVCDLCRDTRQVRAIDVRQWHVHCAGACRFGRWMGQDSQGAVAKSSLHKHPCNVDYMVYPEWKTYVKEMYPGRVRCHVPFAGDESETPKWTGEYRYQKNNTGEVPF